jgi:hypothetical protein
MIVQLDSENGDYNLTSTQTVLTHTPDASNPRLCQGLILLGDGSKNLDASGGDFELTIQVGSQIIEPGPQTITFGSNARSAVWTTPFAVPANTQVLLKIKSPNASDTDVDVTAYLYALDVEAVIADAVWDETRSDHQSAGTFGEVSAWAGSGVSLTVTPVTATVDQQTFTTQGGSIIDFEAAQHTSAALPFTVVDGDGEAVDLSGKTLQFVVFDSNGAVQWYLETGGSGIVVSGDDNNVASVTYSSTNTASDGRFKYVFRNTTDDTVYASGEFRIKLAPVGS